MKNVIQGTTLSGTGAVSIAPGAEITIRNPSGQLVPLWADRAGTQPHDNPFLTDNEGNFRVYADSGWVHVRAQKDGSVREWRYVPLGSAAAMDIGEVYEALGAEVYSSVSEGLSNSAEGDFFLVESGGALDLYRVVNGVAEQRAAGIDDNAILATRAYADDVASEAESNATNAAAAAADAAYQQATEYSDSQLQTHRESGDHDGRYYTKTEVDQALDGKVDEGDPRLSDAREWTAETVSQAEAEAGTSTTRRAWTAQRVRQAIVAGYNALTSAFGRTLANASDATAARNTLGLGTAATRDVGTGANNVVVGSDTRLSDAREWIAPMVTQAEVEGGESTEPRKWSVEMVKLAAEIYGGSGSGDTGLPSPIVPDTFLQAKADGSGYEAKTAQQVADILRMVMPPSGHIAGLRVSNNAADPDNDIDIAPGEAADSTATHLLRLTSTLTKRLDAAWAEGSGQGGLFSGSKAPSTTYYLFLIRRDSDGTVDAGFDTDPEAANRPAGWSAYAKVWELAVHTDDSGNIAQFTHNGDEIVIYPNGGTPEAPAAITVNSRYVLENPYPGSPVSCEVQLFHNGEWGTTGWYVENTAAGARAGTLGGKIVVQTGNRLLGPSNLTGDPFGLPSHVTGDYPARVRVWKVKGAM